VVFSEDGRRLFAATSSAEAGAAGAAGAGGGAASAWVWSVERAAERLDATGAGRQSGPLRGVQGLLGLVQLQDVGAAFLLAERGNELLVVGARSV
jgi:hypothetical protein